MLNNIFPPLIYIALAVPLLCLISDVQFRRKPRPALYLTLVWVAVIFGRQTVAADALFPALTGASLLGGIGLALQALKASDTRVTQCLAAFGLLIGIKPAALVCLYMLVPLALIWLFYRLWKQFSSHSRIQPAFD